MKPSYYREKWQTLKNSAVDAGALSQLAREIGHSFLDHYYQDGLYEQDYIDLICEMASNFSDIELNSAVSTVFFSVVMARVFVLISAMTWSMLTCTWFFGKILTSVMSAARFSRM